MGVARKLDKDQEAFESQQLSGLEGVADKSAEDILTEAVKINLIDQETKDKIATATDMEGHAEKFQKTLDKLGKGPEAFKRAFKLVYGRFLMEQEGLNVKSDSKIIEKLKGVLKFEIDEHGLKGRPELQAAARRLRVYGANKAGAGDPIDEILKKAFGEKADAKALKEHERKVHHATHKKGALEEDHKYFDGDEVKGLGKKAEAIKDSTATAATVRQKKAALDATIENKAKLEDLKKLFAEEKTSDVQDKFLKLQGLWSHHTKAPADLDKQIIAKSAEVDLVRGTIDNFEKSGRQISLDAINRKEERLAQLRSNLATAKAESSSAAKVANLEAEIGALETSLEQAREKLKNDDAGDVANRSKLVSLKGELADLEKIKAKRDEFKTLLQTFRTEVLGYARGLEKAISLGVFGNEKAAEIERLKKFFDGLNADTAMDQTKMNEVINNYNEVKSHFDAVSKSVSDQLKSPELGVEEKHALDQDQEKIEAAKTFYNELKAVIEKIEKAADHGVIFKKDFITTLKDKFKDVKKPEDKDFSASTVASFYNDQLKDLLGDKDKRAAIVSAIETAMVNAEKEEKDAEKALKKLKEAADKYKNLTDDQAAKKIIGAMVYEQFPDISPMEHNKLVTMILADDVATLQTDEGYEALAQRGSAEAMEAAKFANVRKRLLNFKYKEGDKVIQPFKGLKPDDFKDWEHIEKLFTFGKLNYKNAFFVLAAFQHFDGDVKSIQSVKLEKKLKELLAKQMGVEGHMDKAGISKIVDDAFKAQLAKVKPIMQAHSELVGGKKYTEAKEHKKHVLDMKYADLNDQLRTKKIGQEVYEHKLKALIKEAADADVKLEFSGNTVAAQFWNSPEAQWLKDLGHDTGVFVGKKTFAVAAATPFKLAGKGLWGGAKLGASLGFQGAMLPFRAAKYPLLLAAKPVVGFINLFRANKWTPLPGIRDSIKNDAARVVGYATEKSTGVVKGTAKTVTETAAGEWGKVKYTATKYEDRNKHDAAERAEMMKIHEPKSELEPIELPDSPFVDLKKYEKQIDMVAKALGISIEAPHGHEVKVGHETEAKKDEHAHDAHGHAAEVKKEEHAHGAHDAHGAEHKKAEGGHH